MNFNLVPTLERIALVHVTTKLWNEPDIRFQISQFSNSPSFVQNNFDFVYFQTWSTDEKEKWPAIQNKVNGKLSRLMIPRILKEKILSFIHPIGFQIVRWLYYHRKYYSIGLHLPNEFYWTPQGTIDKMKTAQLLINDENINITTRYKLACIYCLEHDVQKLWNEMPESYRTFFYDEENPSRVQQQILIVFWTYFIKGEVDKMDKMIREKYNENCSYRYTFVRAAHIGNKEATQYFLQKLTSRNVVLVETALSIVRNFLVDNYNCTITSKDYHTDVLFFLLSQMNEEQQIQVLKSRPPEVMKTFLDWPWQPMFLEAARLVWNFLEGVSDFTSVMRLIIEKVLIGYTDYNYHEMFGKLWQQIPDTDRSSLIDGSTLTLIIFLLLQTNGGENIKLIFQNASLIEKKNLIFSRRGRFICADMVTSDAWDLLKFFVQLCISSKEELIRFKREFQEHALRSATLGAASFGNGVNQFVFYKLLDDFACEFDKRKRSDEDDSSAAKRQCKSSNIPP